MYALFRKCSKKFIANPPRRRENSKNCVFCMNYVPVSIAFNSSRRNKLPNSFVGLFDMQKIIQIRHTTSRRMQNCLVTNDLPITRKRWDVNVILQEGNDKWHGRCCTKREHFSRSQITIAESGDEACIRMRFRRRKCILRLNFLNASVECTTLHMSWFLGCAMDEPKSAPGSSLLRSQ